MNERDRILIRIDQLMTELGTHWSWIAEVELDYLRRRLYQLDRKR